MYSGYLIVKQEDLTHHGILGMHWGIRRYQPYPKGYKGRGKEVGQAKTAAMTREQRKEHILKTGTATEVLTYKDEFTTAQLQEALTRIRLETQLKELSLKEQESAMNRIDKVFKRVGTVNSWMKTTTDTYNNMNSVMNILGISNGQKEKEGSDKK